MEALFCGLCRNLERRAGVILRIPQHQAAHALLTTTLTIYQSLKLPIIPPHFSILRYRDIRVFSGVVWSIGDCQSGVWARQSGGWKTLPLSDTAAFNPQCEYVMNGARASYVASSQIMTVQNTASGATTATWQVINSGTKGTTYIAQDNYANNSYYGGSATSGISYSCP